MPKQVSPIMKKTIGFRLMAFFLIIILIATMVGLAIFSGGGIVNSISSLQQNYITASVNHWDLPIFFTFPGLLALIVICFLRLVDLDTQDRIDACMKVVIVIGFLFLAVRIPFGFIASSYMESKGYTYCYYLTSAAARSDQVWVRDPDYCIDDTGAIRIELLEWLHETQDAGLDPTPQEVRIKADELFRADLAKQYSY
jgi:hypothetical protein